MKIHLHDQNLDIHQVTFVSHREVYDQSRRNGVETIIDTAPMLFGAL